MREKKMTITPYFTWKTSKNIFKKKNTSLQLIENIYYEEQKLNTMFYLTQSYLSSFDHLTSTFPLSVSRLLLKHTWSPH